MTAETIFFGTGPVILDEHFALKRKRSVCRIAVNTAPVADTAGIISDGGRICNQKGCAASSVPDSAAAVIDSGIA